MLLGVGAGEGSAFSLGTGRSREIPQCSPQETVGIIEEGIPAGQEPRQVRVLGGPLAGMGSVSRQQWGWGRKKSIDAVLREGGRHCGPLTPTLHPISSGLGARMREQGNFKNVAVGTGPTGREQGS